MEYEAGTVPDPAANTRNVPPRSPPYSPSDEERPSKLRKHGSRLVSALRSIRNSGMFITDSSMPDTDYQALMLL